MYVCMYVCMYECALSLLYTTQPFNRRPPSHSRQAAGQKPVLSKRRMCGLRIQGAPCLLGDPGTRQATLTTGPVGFCPQPKCLPNPNERGHSPRLLRCYVRTRVRYAPCYTAHTRTHAHTPLTCLGFRLCLLIPPHPILCPM